jgi:ribosome-binding protein aMBF1 (putative translation factor)
MNYEEFKKEALEKNPELKREYDALAVEYQVMKAVLEARVSKGLSQQQLAELMGTSQANISKLENGVLNPSVKLLDRVARACDMKLTVIIS